MKVFSAAVSALLYLAALCGVFLIFRKDLKALAKRIKLSGGLRARSRAARKRSKVELHMENLFRATLGLNVSGRTAIALFVLLFLAVFSVGTRSLPARTAFISALAIAAMPYFFLRIKLEVSRRKASFEGESFVADLLSAYRICGANIYAAMERLSAEKQTAAISCRHLQTLLYELREAGTEENARLAADKFAFAIATNWSRMLAYNIFVAATRGTDVSPALEDVLLQLREARTLAEERKRLNGEAMRMVVVLIPLLYAATVFTSVKYLGTSLKTFAKNQFFTPEGFLIFVVCAALFFLNLLLLEVVNNQKFDY